MPPKLRFYYRFDGRSRASNISMPLWCIFVIKLQVHLFVGMLGVIAASTRFQSDINFWFATESLHKIVWHFIRNFTIHDSTIRCILQYRASIHQAVRCLTAKSREVSELQDWMRCCRGACQISKRLERSQSEFRGFESSRDLVVRCLSALWIGAQYQA